MQGSAWARQPSFQRNRSQFFETILVEYFRMKDTLNDLFVNFGAMTRGKYV